MKFTDEEKLIDDSKRTALLAQSVKGFIKSLEEDVAKYREKVSMSSAISPEVARRIIIRALDQKILIIADDDIARKIRTDIKTQIKSMGSYIKVYDSVDGVSAAFIEMIYVMSLVRWNSKKRLKFDGLVLITDEKIFKPQYLADGVKICRLPMIRE